jgi:hypothetical protein
VISNLKPVKPDRRLTDDRTALSKDAIKNAFLDDLFYVQGKFPALATNNDYYMALAYAVRDRMLQRWISTAAAYKKTAREPSLIYRPSSSWARTLAITSSIWAYSIPSRNA